jgi:hypothetical protein
MLCTFKMYIIYTPICTSFITIFVQERERGRFNRARDGASREPWQSTGERRGSAGGARRASHMKRCPNANPQNPQQAAA